VGILLKFACQICLCAWLLTHAVASLTQSTMTGLTVCLCLYSACKGLSGFAPPPDIQFSQRIQSTSRSLALQFPNTQRVQLAYVVGKV